jgi:hypothetical protein
MARHSSTYRCNRKHADRIRPGAARRAALREQRLAVEAAVSIPAAPAEAAVEQVVDLDEQRRQRKNELARARRAAKKEAEAAAA